MFAKPEPRHKPGVWKQQNKGHSQGKHRSKREIDVANKGRVPVKLLTKKVKGELHRHERRNQAKQIRSNKRDEVLAKKRSLGGHSTLKDDASPPFLVAIVSLSESIDSNQFMEMLSNCSEDITKTESSNGIKHISLSRFKQRYSFIVPEPGNLYSILDSTKVADTLLLLWPADYEEDKRVDILLKAISAQGLPTTVHVIQGMESVPAKKKQDVKKAMQKLIEKRFPEEKANVVEKPQDAILVFHQIGSQKQRPVYWRDHRSHMLVEKTEFVPNADSDSAGTLKVSGYIRGQPLSVNRLVHIPGWGDFQLSQIDLPTDPHPLIVGKRSKDVDMSSTDCEVLTVADPTAAESLHSEMEPDPLDGEQTWPTEEEMQQARDDLIQAKRKVKRVLPKGMSEHVAAWVLPEDEGSMDSDEDESDSEEETDDEFRPVDDEDQSVVAESDIVTDDYRSVAFTDTDDPDKYDAKMDYDDEERELKLKMAAAKEDEKFPDEVEVPFETPAKIRFQKYRGLQSFRTSPWDKYENLPHDYSRIITIGNARAMKKFAMKPPEEEKLAKHGWYVTLHITNVPKLLVDSNKGQPLVVYGMLPYEQKMTVVNMTIKCAPHFDGIVQSKERLIFHLGYRRFSACPIFSQHTLANKQKYERFLKKDSVTVATVFAPNMFPTAHVLVFREQRDGSQELVATGNLLSADCNRLVIKRIVLTGHPLKITGRSAVVRYMFHTREDIDWFKSVELRSRYGRRGHIRDSLGTHGHMKCSFNTQLKSQDVVMMNLYKRVFPKWTYDTTVSVPKSLFSMPSSDVNDEVDDYDME